MKQVLCLLVVAITLVSCSKSPEQKAKDLIKEEMKKSMNDFSSYEPVEYGKLDSSFSVLDISTEQLSFDAYSKEAKKILGDMEIEAVSNLDDYKIDKVYFDSYKFKMDSVSKIIDAKAKSFKPEFKGWKMSHKFRGKNKMGAVVLNSNIYEFDKDITKIVDETKLDN